MSYSIEEDGSRHYRPNSKREIITPKAGQDFYVDRINSRLGKLGILHGRVFHPVDVSDTLPKVQQENGWSAPAAAYYGTASKMASLGVATAVYDLYHPPSFEDIKDPLLGAERGGLEMLNIFEDLAGDGELALIGHSTGGITAARIALKDDRVSYVIGEAPAGIAHRDMFKYYLKNLPGISEELGSFLVNMPKNRFSLNILREFITLNMTDPTRLVRQLAMLSSGPDSAPILDEVHQKGVLNGLILFKEDKFLNYDNLAEIVSHKKQLFDVVRVVDEAKHLHPNRYSSESAEVRITVLDELRDLKMGQLAISNTR